MVKLICGSIIAALSAFIAVTQCVKVPRNLRGYYQPGYIILGVLGFLAGIATAVSGALNM